MSKNQTDISIIIPTYNGKHKLGRIINALELQKNKNFETLIMIDGSNDGTKEYLERTKFKLKNLNFHYSKNVGRAAIRNLGAQIANAELILFFDDDMFPNENCVNAHIEHHCNFTNTILVGNVLDEYFSNEVSDFLRFKSFLSQKWSEKYKGKTKLNRANLFISAAHFSINKSQFQDLGMFNKELNDAEDWDFAVRAFLSETEIYLDADNIAFHQDFTNCRNYISRRREYTRAQLKLNKINEDVLKNNFSRVQELHPGFVKRTVYHIISRKFFVKLIDGNRWLKIIPKSLRFKFYDAVIVGLVKVFPQRKI